MSRGVSFCIPLSFLWKLLGPKPTFAAKAASSLTLAIAPANRTRAGVLTADDYSMEIELPLTDCPQNLAIIGMIPRKDVDIGDIFFDAVLKK